MTAPRTDDRGGVRVAVDAMGGDHGPAEIVPGALDHARANPDDEVLLVGQPDALASFGPFPANVRIVPAAEVIGMDEHPALALREKKNASILVACDLVKRGEADAVITAGHTGAAMAAAILRIGRLPGVDRPALAVQMIRSGTPFVLLDIGANPDSSAENLAQYARMGAIFAERVLGVAKPRVALLSIGQVRKDGSLELFHRRRAVIELFVREPHVIEMDAVDGVLRGDLADDGGRVILRRRLERGSVEAFDGRRVRARPSREAADVGRAAKIDLLHLRRKLTRHHQPFRRAIDDVVARSRQADRA